jgi:hypothetical protein
VSPPGNAAVRRFRAVWVASVAVKLVALTLFALLVVKLAGGF